MKIKISLIVLAFSFLMLQGCGSETKESKDSAAQEQASLEAAKKADERSAKRILLAKATTQKAEERRLAAIERAKLTPTYKDEFGNIVFIKAEIDPSFQGGDDAMHQYLLDNLKYPKDARNLGIEGTVFVDFVVDSKGAVKQVVATDVIGENVDFSLKEESVRVVASMPRWIAGLQQGKAVNVSFTIPISFEIAN